MLTIGAAVLLAAQPTPAATDYGAAMRYEDGVKIGEAYIRRNLADPYSAHFEWPNTFVPFTEKVPMFKRTTGYATCLVVNAKNQYGGYVGERTYRIIIRDGKVIDYAPVSELRFVPDICQELATKFGMTPLQTQ
ncbi:hypothetical protein GCM10008023_06000 [Sphingomonas glacialis]|uniref:Uncharacterized protein n=1 Tax=Sphingomonas glacialis TaxID=658225 RepID=A0ABQ3LFA1_9SPHN|nr:hypothetical protein [Sphingomonas glacialis]GHH09382.1 hypothetical protein GCM10008023_06000 [Sphingomonas glacialis]